MPRTHPIAYPIVCANIDESAHTSLQEGSNVVLRREHSVHRSPKIDTDVVVARGEVTSQRWVDANRLTNILAIEEFADVPESMLVPVSYMN